MSKRLGVVEDPCKDVKYLEQTVDAMRVQKDEVGGMKLTALLMVMVVVEMMVVVKVLVVHGRFWESCHNLFIMKFVYPSQELDRYRRQCERKAKALAMQRDPNILVSTV